MISRKCIAMGVFSVNGEKYVRGSRTALFVILLTFSLNSLGQSQIVAHDSIIGVTPISILQDSTSYSWYTDLYKRFKVDSVSLKGIHKSPKQLKFKLFMGSWCSDSRVFVPKFMKIARYLHIDDDQIELIFVNEEKNEPSELIEKNKIRFVPTLIIIDETGEMNRIVELPNESIERDLSSIILKKKYTPFWE